VANAELSRNALAKPSRGSWKLEREKRKSGNDADELAAKKAAKARDGRCRFPLKHKCRGGLEGAHVVDKSRGGSNPVQPLTKLGTNGVE
jgi:hypothetical protein